MAHSEGHSPPPSPVPIIPPSAMAEVSTALSTPATLPTALTASISTVTVKLPLFWQNDPQMWFAQVEAQFATRCITSQKSCYDHVVSSLSPEYATEIRNLIFDPSSSNPYDTLKAKLIQRIAPFERRLQQLLSIDELGDRKLSQLLRRLHQLLGDNTSSTGQSFLRELFLRHLIANNRLVLACNTTVDLNILATQADSTSEITTHPVSVVDHTQQSSEIKQLRAEIVNLRQQFQPSASPRRPRSLPPRKQHSPSPFA
ncbi:PREDICTED: uncharacterized protein LOC105314727 [Amphimedon queenslandica]|nr:PREDICTED: uncharacterized protein LOC105314727 [Amphimedon queenslandica]|eukprot:XP_011407376.1 PREDICTED: uncharacterized protein LOC105314727 [Amphimedon queenslandica]